MPVNVPKGQHVLGCLSNLKATAVYYFILNTRGEAILFEPFLKNRVCWMAMVPLQYWGCLNLPNKFTFDNKIPLGYLASGAMKTIKELLLGDPMSVKKHIGRGNAETWNDAFPCI
jgi:hypothetical protein